MIETTGQIVAGVYTLLRRPSEAELPYPDVQERVNDVVTGLVQEAGLEGRDQHTQVADVTLAADAVDYLLDVPNVSDFEAVRLERGTTVPGAGQVWGEVQVVPFSAWERHFDRGYLAASIYGGFDGRTRVKLNIDQTEFGLSQWRLSYRTSLLQTLQSGDRPPLPRAFLPMVKVESAILCAPLVRRHGREWSEWKREALVLYAAELAERKANWRKYLEHSLEPTVVPLRPFNFYRYGYVKRGRAYLPIGGN